MSSGSAPCRTIVQSTRELVAHRLRERNVLSSAFFAREAEPLARVCREMSGRFERGGRLFAFGTGASASDAQHIAVEFVHPVLAGKRALPACDVSTNYRDWISVAVGADDIVVGFGPPSGDPHIDLALRDAASRGALTLALPGTCGDYAIAPPSSDPFIHQELMEVLYHTLWETVHVFFDRRPLGQAAGAASFLYPFLGSAEQSSEDLIPEVAASIAAKAASVEQLRDRAAAEDGERIAAAALDISERIAAGATVLCFGNGGSATDANDLALDLLASPKGYRPTPALSLSAEAATLTAIANDIGSEAMFSRLIIAHARRGDVAVALSTSGGSANIIAALTEARARGLLTVALLGYDGGEVRRRGLADHTLIVRSDQIPRVQEIQASMYHVILDALDVLRTASE